MVKIQSDEPSVMKVLTDVLHEIQRSNELHPNYPGRHDPVRRVGIIVEEAGEAMREALDMTRDGTPVGVFGLNPEWVSYEQRLYKETVQTAATSIKLLLHMRGEMK